MRLSAIQSECELMEERVSEADWLEQVDLGQAGFREKGPWWGGDLQTLRNQFIARRVPLPGLSTTLAFATSDESGDRLIASLETPLEPAGESPLVLLVHGLTGSADSTYIRETARFHLVRGRTVLRLNLRGAGAGKDVATGYYHAGRASDIRDVLSGLDRERIRHGVFPVGFSLGGNILLNLIGDVEPGLPVIGAATVSAPIEPFEACRRIMAPRNVVYHRYLLRGMKRDVLVSGKLSDRERRAVATARSVYEFDDRWVAPRNGFRDARDYYERTAGARHIPRITVPTLMLHARNDPWIPSESYLRAAETAPSNVEIRVARSGGHVGFHESGHAETWHDRAIDGFLARITAASEHR